MKSRIVVALIGVIGLAILGCANWIVLKYRVVSPFHIVEQETGGLSVHVTMKSTGTSPIGLHYAEHLAWLKWQ